MKFESEEDYLVFLAGAKGHLQQTMADYSAKFSISSYKRQEYDGAKNELTFWDQGATKPKVVAKTQVAGTFHKRTHQWLWGWADSEVSAGECSALRRVRAEAMEAGMSDFCEDNEIDLRGKKSVCWQFASVASYILKAQGCYEVDCGEKYYYLIFMAIDWSGF